MDCQHARLLLTFTRRRVEAMEAADRAAVARHLETCPDCAALAQNDAALDQAVGPVLRDVAVPESLRCRVSDRLDAAGPRRWPWVAAAASVMLAVGLSAYFYLAAPGYVGGGTLNDLTARAGAQPEDVEEWFAAAGLTMQAPRDFDYRHLMTYDVVEFEGRRVPKLVFYRPNERNDSSAWAQVLVLSKKQFATGDLPEMDHWTPFNVHTIRHNEHVILALSTSANLEPFLSNAPRQ